MNRSLPPLNALRAFEAAARLQSYTAAAHELGVTQGAISRQVANLEEMLGVPLFVRVRQRISLTPAGTAYAEEVRDALNRLSAATLNAVAFKGAGGPLALAHLRLRQLHRNVDAHQRRDIGVGHQRHYCHPRIK